MEFSIEFYETLAGDCPVQEFLDDLRRRDPNDFTAVLSGLGRLRNHLYHRPPLSKAIGDGLFEMRHVGKLNTRIVYFFMCGQRIIAVHGIRNKSWEIPNRDRRIALARMTDWIERHKP